MVHAPQSCFCVPSPSDCVPDISAFDEESDMGKLVRKLHGLLKEAEAQPYTPAVPVLESGEAKDALRMLGLKVGDKVVVGGVKVRQPRNVK